MELAKFGLSCYRKATVGNIFSQSYFIAEPALTEKNLPDLKGKVSDAQSHRQRKLSSSPRAGLHRHGRQLGLRVRARQAPLPQQRDRLRRGPLD